MSSQSASKNVRRAEPVAIVGMGCEFPGRAATPEALWENLVEGRVSVSDVGPERWSLGDYEDVLACSRAGFIDDIQGFDCTLFPISPREAAAMDPQQRVVLETVWKALEHANIPPGRLAGTATGVFLGIGHVDHSLRALDARHPGRIDGYAATGTLASVIAGRVSYLLDLAGPCLVTDTACSSSLVSVHVACQSLGDGSCELAIAGGVNVITDPALSVALTKMGALSPRGVCAAFDASADGFVRGEGCGVVVLKRLADAERDGDRVLGVLLSTAINHDGRSNGLTAPSTEAQKKLIRIALERAGIEAHTVHHVEAHGTGTPLGDPIELRALAETYGRDRREDLLVTSVKANVGHLEGAAGIVGLIKSVLVLGHAEVPPQALLQTPTPHIPWDELRIRVPRERTPLVRSSAPLRAAVSSFGFSGTNAHALLERYEAPARAEADGRELELLPLSAQSPRALTARLEQVAALMSDPACPAPATIARTLATGREHLTVRRAVVAPPHELPALLRKAAEEPVRTGSRPPFKLAFLFSGQGAQWPGMARALYRELEVFRRTLDECEAIWRELASWSLLELLVDDTEPRRIHETVHTQPACFALQYALARQWIDWGLRPRAVMGHSIGEYAAAVVAGALDLRDGLRLIEARGRSMQDRCARGAMLAVELSEAEAVSELAHPQAFGVTIAAINAERSVVLAGSHAAIESFQAHLRSAGVTTRSLEVSHAFHSPMMEPMLDAFAEVARDVRLRAPRIPFISTVTAKRVRNELGAADYWVRQVMAPVRFQPALVELQRLGTHTLVELGPGAQLTAMVLKGDHDAPMLPSMRAQVPSTRQLWASLGALYERGADVDWESVWASRPGPRCELPPYPFQRDRFAPRWPPSPEERRPRAPLHALLDRPLSGEELDGAELGFETDLDVRRFPFVEDHRIEGSVVMPGVMYMELMLAALATGAQERVWRLASVEYHKVLVLSAERQQRIRILAHRDGPSRYSLRVLAAADAGSWTLQATGAAEPCPDSTARALLA